MDFNRPQASGREGTGRLRTQAITSEQAHFNLLQARETDGCGTPQDWYAR